MPMQYSIVWRFTGRVLPWYFSRAFQSLLKYFSLPSSELLHSSFTKAMGYVIGASESPLEVFESEYAAFGSPRLRLNSRVACQVKNCVWENFKGSASLEWLSIAGLKPQGRLQISADSWDRLVSVTVIKIGRAPLQGSQQWCCFSSPPANIPLFIPTQES